MTGCRNDRPPLARCFANDNNNTMPAGSGGCPCHVLRSRTMCYETSAGLTVFGCRPAVNAGTVRRRAVFRMTIDVRRGGDTVLRLPIGVRRYHVWLRRLEPQDLRHRWRRDQNGSNGKQTLTHRHLRMTRLCPLLRSSQRFCQLSGMYRNVIMEVVLLGDGNPGLYYRRPGMSAAW